MNDHSRQTAIAIRPPRSDVARAAQLSENKISRLLAECLEEAKQLPSGFSASSVPLTRDPEADGPFTTVCKLAAGSVTNVYLAVDQRADAAEPLIVVKHYLPALTHVPEFSARFTRELSLARTLNHACVCKLFDYGRTSSSYYTATEFLQGEPLSNVLTAPALREVGNRSPRLLAHLIAKLAEGLHAIHTAKGAANPAHGDVTSNDLFVLYDGSVRVTNFGTGWMRDFSNQRVASAKCYFSPERLEGAAPEARSDIWALGVVLWELLAGKKLFHCTTNLEAVVEILARDIPSPGTDNPRVTSELERIVLKALARNPDERYGSARELALALQAFIAHSGGPIARTEVVTWLARLFPNGADRCSGLLELATSVPTPLPRFADSFGSAPPVSYAYAPAGEDEVENTTQIYAAKLDESTLRSLEWPLESVESPATLRRPRRDAKFAWRAAFAPFAAAFAIVLLGFFAGQAAFSRARASASPRAAVAPFGLERKRAAPVPATFALKPAAEKPPPSAEVTPPAAPQTAPSPEIGAQENAAEALHVDFDADEPASQPSAPASTIPKPVAHPPTRPTRESPVTSAPSVIATQLGAVYVTTPGGGDVYERGRYLGHAPAEFELSPGWHTLLVKSGDDDRAATVQVPAGSAIVLSLPASKP